MSNEVNFEQFIKLLDGALASDDKNVKQVLRKFLFVTAMVLGDDCEPGPFTKMMETMDAMQRRLATLESKDTVTTTTDWTTTTPYTVGGTASPFITPTTATGGSITGGSSSATGTPPVWINTNAVSTTTTASTTGNITLSGSTGSCGTFNITPLNITPAITSGYSFNPGSSTTTTLNYWINNDNPETGTEIKNDIMKALDRLASAA